MKLKRIMAIVLCFAMVLSTMSFSVFAVDATVTNETELTAALAAGGTVTLGNDIEVASQIEIPNGVEVTLDLAGYDIIAGLNGDSTTNHIYVLSNRGTLTVKDATEEGKIVSRGIYNYGTLILDSGTIEACDGNGGYAVNNENGSTFTMNGGAVVTTYDDDTTTFDTGDATAIDVCVGNTTTLNGGKISCVSNWCYAVSVDGTLVVPEDSTVSVTGVHGAVSTNSSGTTTIGGGTFVCEGATNASSDHVLYVSGNGSLTVNGGTFTNNNTDTGSNGVAVCADGDGTEVEINNGTFTGCEAVIYGNVNTVVNGGSYELHWDDIHDIKDSLAQYVAEGATVVVEGTEMTKTESGLEEDTSATETVVATVNGEEFTDLQEAIKAAAPDGTVEILADVTVDEWVMIAESLTIGNDNLITLAIDGMTINGNGHTLTINSIESAGNGGYLFFDAANLNVNNLTIEYAEGLAGAIALKSGTLDNVTFDGCVYGVIPQSGDVVIQDCTFKTAGTSIYFEEERDGLTVTGCTFENADTVNVILLRGDVNFTNNTVLSGRTVNVVSGSPVVTGNDFGNVRFKVYNEATATVEDNTINNLVFNDTSEVKSTFGENTLSAEAQAVLDAAGVWDGVIETKEDLLKFNELGRQESGNNNLQGKTFILANDIDFEWDEWYPFNFYGTFVGNGHSIKNLTYIPNTDGRMGFFQSFAGNIEGGLTLDGIKGTVPDGGNFGGFARYLNGNITDVSVKNITLEVGTNVNWYIGGFGGYANSGNITDCSVENFVLNASALSAGEPCIGGFIGSVRCNPIYTNCDVKGFKVIINSTTDLGLAGFTPHTQTGWNNVKFVDCDVTGIDFTVTGRADVAGFVTWPGSHTSATNCHTVGKIDVTGVTTGNYAGGFYGNLGWNADLGQMGHFLTNCSADVDVLTKIVDAGGFIGSATVQGNGSKYLECTNCTASGDVTVVEGGAADVGAFAGSADRGVYNDCSASGTVTNNGTGKAGQFIGAFYDVTPKYDHRYPAGTRDYLVDEITVEDCAYTGASTELDFIGYTADDANVEIGVSAAKIGDTYFKTFEAALNAVADGQTITLLGGTSSDELSKEIDFTKDISFTITGIAPEYALPVVTFQNATVTIKDAEILIPELDARQDATINVVDSIVHDAGGNGIVKSYFNGAINISGTSVVYTMQVTTMGYITVSDTAKLNATWQVNVYGNGLVTVEDDAALVTAALQLTGQDYSGRDNTDADRVGKSAEVIVDGATLTIGKVYSDSGADYSYHSSYGINIGTVEGKEAVFNAKNGAKVNIYMDKNQSVNVGANGTVNVADSSLITACRAVDGEMTFVNNGTVNVSGTSDIAAKVTGSGWVYMDGVTLDADTKLNGANVRFASGTNNIDGSVIDNGKFQVGIGAYNGVDSRVDTVNGVIVNVKNATIGSKDGAYAGWIGTGYYDTDAEKTAAMTDAEYVLNIENSIAEFGYLHISNDGVLNVKGNATEKANYNGSDYSFRGGDFIVNGTATFDATDVFAIDTKISCDNGTTAPGTLNIVNGTTYEAERHNGAIAGNTFRLFKTGVANVDEASELYIGEPSSVAADAVMNINGKVTALGEIANNGTINVAEDALLTANGSVKVNGNLKSTGNIFGTIAKADDAVIEITGGTYTQDVSAWCPNGYICENNGNGTYSVINTTPSAYTVTVKASEDTVRYNNGNPDTFTVDYIVTGGNVIGAMAQYNYDNTLFTCAEDDDKDGKLILYNNDLTTDANGETIIAKLTFTVKKDVEVDTTYEFLAEKFQVTSDYDAAGSGAQDGFVENVVGDEVTVVAQWKVTLPGDNSLAGNTYVDKNTDYSATINNFDENMTYTIKYTMGDGAEQTIEVTENNFVIETVTGDIVFTDVSYELNCEIVLVPDYVNGCTLVIVKDGVANGYTYDNAPMYSVARYENITELPSTANQYIVGNILNATSVRAILIKGAVDEAQARAAIKAAVSEPADIEKSFDVNGNGKLFHNDAMVAHGCLKEQYDLAQKLAYYLRADVDTDLKIRTLDYDATVGAILDELYGN